MKVHKLQLLVILIFLFVSSLFAENQSGIEKKSVVSPFVQKVTGVGRLVDAIQTRDGNYVSINTVQYGDGTSVIRKATASGRRIWERVLLFHTTEGGYAFLRKIAETSDGYVLVGSGPIDGYYGPTNGIVIKLHPNGTLNWSQRFGNGGDLSFDSVTPTPDGGFIVTGGMYPPIFHPIVVRFTSQGNILWAKNFETLSYNFYSQSLSDNGLVLASTIFGENTYTIGATLVRMDSSGQINWSKNLTLNDSAVSLGSTLDNGMIIATKPGNFRNLSLVRLDETGKILWKAKYHLDVAGFSISHVSQTPDGGYLITGTTTDKAGAIKDGFFLKIDAQRKLVLQKIFGANGDSAGSMFATREGAYVLFGSTHGSTGIGNDMLFLNLNSDGVVPGCSFVRHLKAKRLQPTAIPISTPRIESQLLSLPPPNALQITIASSRKPSSTTCR